MVNRSLKDASQGDRLLGIDSSTEYDAFLGS